MAEKDPHDEFLIAQMASLPAIPAIERLSSTVIRVLGGNPGKFSLQGTNTYLVGTGNERLLIDTAQGFPAWIQSLSAVLADEKASISKVLCTHWHHDHVGGIKDVLGISPPTTKVFKHKPDAGQIDIEDGQEFSVEGATLKAVFTPGHTVDHMSFILAEENALFTGDNVLGHGTSVFEDLATYTNSLKRMLELKTARGYPGHGKVLEDSQSKIQAYLTHRQRREDQIVAVLNKKQEVDRLAAIWGGKGNRNLTSMEIVKDIYRNVGEDLHRAAEMGALQVLAKLEAEGRVGREESEGETRWYLKDKATL
ncbi:hypothetical protein RUND412_006512 [Rhizina undulata]